LVSKDGFNGVCHKLFKLRAKLPQCEKIRCYKILVTRSDSPGDLDPHRKFAIRSILVRRTIIEHGTFMARGQRRLRPPVVAQKPEKSGFSAAQFLPVAGMSIASLGC
jgi:hypothetical protein